MIHRDNLKQQREDILKALRVVQNECCTGRQTTESLQAMADRLIVALAKIDAEIKTH